MIYWEGMEKEIRKIYKKDQGIKGQFAYTGISLFKIRILSHWYDHSDVGTEELVKESLSCMRFCSFRLEDQIPDYTTLCRVRNEIVAKNAYEILLKKINKELKKHQAIVKIEVIVNASITVNTIDYKGVHT
ncbi:MAG: transposase [Flavobacteriales bacterium Tduv]